MVKRDLLHDIINLNKRFNKGFATYDEKWSALVLKETKKPPQSLESKTPEGITLKPLYTATDLPDLAESTYCIINTILIIPFILSNYSLYYYYKLLHLLVSIHLLVAHMLQCMRRSHGIAMPIRSAQSLVVNIRILQSKDHSPVCWLQYRRREQSVL